MHDPAKIRNLRKKRGLTQAQAAAAAAISRQQWCNIETAHTGQKRGITLLLLGKVATALRVRPMELIAS